MSVGLTPMSLVPANDRAAERAGLLAIDKPAGVTSHDVGSALRRRLRVKRAGHLGTLDPAATGLLLVATGPATRAISAWQGGDKTYEAVVRFGIVTTTQDTQGDVLERSDRLPTESEARTAALALTGEIEQVPPMVSALKVGGKRLYSLARQGIEVERAPRRVTVKRWDWLAFDGATARFRIVCTGGTYVRTLAHDLGRALGCGGALEQLRRLRSEPFGLERALPLRECLTLAPAEIWERAGYTLEQALGHLPRFTLTSHEAESIGFGARPRVGAARAAAREPGVAAGGALRPIVFNSPDGRVLALGELVPAADAGTPADGAFEVRARVVFPWSAREGSAA